MRRPPWRPPELPPALADRQPQVLLRRRLAVTSSVLVLLISAPGFIGCCCAWLGGPGRAIARLGHLAAKAGVVEAGVAGVIGAVGTLTVL